MPSAKDLKKRLASVKSSEQITKAMKMVSAAKLRRAQEAIVALRPFAREVQGVIATLAKVAGEEHKHPLLAPKPANERRNVLAILVTSDRGLCGAFNSNIIRMGQKFLRENEGKYDKLDLAFVGKRGYDYFRTKRPGKNYPDFFKGLNYLKAKGLAQELIELYMSGEYDEIKFIYNEFKSALSQKLVVEDFLPILPPEQAANAETTMTIYEPSLEKILEGLLERHFATHAYRIFLESWAGEQGARMTAMENATRNAGDMIRKIGLLYNKTRQAGITKELLEIVAGTEAQKV